MIRHRLLDPAKTTTALLLFALTAETLIGTEAPTNLSDDEPRERWKPAPPPPNTDFDWIGLTSGEWLKGEIKSIYDDEIEFDSDKLGLLTLDTEDVGIIRSAGRFTLNLGTRQIVSGRIVANEKVIRVYDGDTSATVSRERLVAAVAEKQKEIDLWSAKIGLGATFRSGNTDQIEYNAKINLQRRSAFSRFRLDYLGSLSRTNDVKTEDNALATSTFDIFLGRRWFVRPAGAEYFRDTFQNIEYRITGYGGAGYQLIDSPKLEWDLFAGPGYLRTEYVERTEDGEAAALAAIVSSRFEYELNSVQDLTGTYQASFTDRESGGYLHNLTLALENELIDDFDIDITFVWSRINHPAETSDGSTPEPDDYQLIFSLGYEM